MQRWRRTVAIVILLALVVPAGLTLLSVLR
jgi:hypothetical protein